MVASVSIDWACKIDSIMAGNFSCSVSKKAATRTPPAHPEGYLETFANLYTAAFDAMVQRSTTTKWNPSSAIFLTVEDGWEGMRFIDNCVKSSKEGGVWLKWAKAA